MLLQHTSVLSRKPLTNVSLGTMTMGDQCDDELSLAMLQLFLSHHSELDTAFLYPRVEREGVTEELLGRVLGTHPELRAKAVVATKANVWTKGGLTAESVRRQCEGSLKRLQLTSVDIFYLHMPDHNVPASETLAAVDALYREGKFKRFGLSNYAAWEVVEIWHLCDKNGWVKPTVYQGMYNLLTRAVEPELFVALKKYGIAFYAYNVTCGGFVGGDKNAPRFTTSAHADRYKARYINDAYGHAVQLLLEGCKQHNLDPYDVAIRWAIHHSKMDPEKGDTVIIGASKVAHLEKAVASVKADRLPEDLLKIIDEAASISKQAWQTYFR